LKKVAINLIAFAFFYTTCFVAARLSHNIILLENLSLNRGSRVIAKPEEWIDMTKEMARASGSFLLRVDLIARDIKPDFLNSIFWPLRKLEEFYWNSRQTDQIQTPNRKGSLWSNGENFERYQPHTHFACGRTPRSRTNCLPIPPTAK